jgi:hypothetical protein
MVKQTFKTSVDISRFFIAISGGKLVSHYGRSYITVWRKSMDKQPRKFAYIYGKVYVKIESE